MKQTATTVQQIPIDMTYGYPGELPSLKTSGDTQKLLQFFVYHAQGMNIRDAARKVGYSERWAKGYSYGYTKKYADYLAWLQAHFAQAAAKHITIDQERVLEEIEAIAMANWHDYLVHETGKNGKIATRLKRLDELTKDQMRCIEVVGTGGPKSVITYKFRDRDGKLTELAKTMGLLNEKVILEHRHRHLHVHTDLTKVPMQQLEALEAQFEEILMIEHKPEAELTSQEPQMPARKANGNGKGH
jgi:Terminase small subunit